MSLNLLYPVQNPIITQGFGEHAVDYTKFGYPGHNGIDFGCEVGTEVLAAADGQVYAVKWENGGFGKYIIVDHYEGYYTLYAHLSDIQTKPGKLVVAGSMIALSGKTGFCTGPHLHFGLKGHGGLSSYRGYIDPMPFIGNVGKPINQATQNLNMKFVVMSDTLNVRKGPGIGNVKVGELEKGDEVCGVAFSGELWVKLENGNYVNWVFDQENHLKEIV